MEKGFTVAHKFLQHGKVQFLSQNIGDMCVLNLDFVDSDRDRVDTNDDDGEEIDDKDDNFHFSFFYD